MDNSCAKPSPDCHGCDSHSCGTNPNPPSSMKTDSDCATGKQAESTQDCHGCDSNSCGSNAQPPSKTKIDSGCAASPADSSSTPPQQSNEEKSFAENTVENMDTEPTSGCSKCEVMGCCGPRKTLSLHEMAELRKEAALKNKAT